MPELPEVETIRRQLAPEVVGATITSLTVSDPRWCSPLAPEELGDVVVGRRVLALRRRGKYLDWVLEGEVHLLMHLRMTGTLLLEPGQDFAHTRVELTLDGSRRLLFVDPRRFGTGQLVVGDGELESFYASRLGIEPFDEAFTPALLRELARGRRGPIKSFLLDQRQIAGIGNIYADEALFRTGVHPLRPAGTLRPADYARLRDAIREVLSAGIDARAPRSTTSATSTARAAAFRTASSSTGARASPASCAVRQSASSSSGGRGTYVCARCQPAPRRRRRRLRG